MTTLTLTRCKQIYLDKYSDWGEMYHRESQRHTARVLHQELCLPKFRELSPFLF